MKIKKIAAIKLSPVITFAAIVIIIAGIKSAEQIINPFILAVFISVISTPPIEWMKKKGMPHTLAVITVIIFMILLIIGLGGITGTSVAQFSENLPKYESRLREIELENLQYLDALGIDFSEEHILQTFDSSKIMSFTATLLNSLGGFMGTSLLIFITVLFMLLELNGFIYKFSIISKHPKETQMKLAEISSNINRYLTLKTITSISTGILVAIWLSIIGVDFPVLWGLLAFLLNYIPNIGSMLAAIPAVLLAIIQLGPSGTIWTIVGYLVINLTIGSFIEPRVMGRGLGISTLVVFLSLIFWGWVLGPIGMFLSVPLTMAIKIAFDSDENTKWFAILLSSVKKTADQPLLVKSEENENLSG